MVNDIEDMNQIDELMSLEDYHIKDVGKTNEINILTRENRKLCSALGYIAEHTAETYIRSVAEQALEGE